MLLKSHHISSVIKVKGPSKENYINTTVNPYEVPEKLGLIEEIDPLSSQMEIETIAERIIENRQKYLQRFTKKSKAQEEFDKSEREFLSEK